MKEKSLAFAKRIVNAYRSLCEEQKEYVLSKRFLRGDTGIGDNITETQYASSKKDFLGKTHIALKECAEPLYWVECLFSCDYLSENEYVSLQTDCTQTQKLRIEVT